MKRLKRMMEIVWDKRVNDDWDEVICIVGKNRVGKTNLALHWVEDNIMRLYGKCEPEMANKYIGISAKSFAGVLGNANKFDAIMDDESGDIGSRNSMTKINKLYMQGYQVIAAENLLTILVLPEFWDLDPYFRKTRVRHLIEVYSRGRCRVYSNKRLKTMLGINEGYPVKNYNVVKPSFHDDFGKYKGPLLEEYQKMKDAKMLTIRKDIMDEIQKEHSVGAGTGNNLNLVKRDELIGRLIDAGSSVTEIMEKFAMSKVSVSKALQRRKIAEFASEL